MANHFDISFEIEELRNLPLEQRTFSPLFFNSIKKHANQPFITDGEKRYTYAQFGQQVLSLVHGLATLGIEKGTLVPLIAGNSIEYVMTWFALHLRGAQIAFVNPTLKGRVFEQVLISCKSKYAFITTEVLNQLQEIDTSIYDYYEHLILIDTVQAQSLQFNKNPKLKTLDALYQEVDSKYVSPTHFSDIQSIFFTSGSTGPSKAVMMPNGHFFANPCSFIKITDLTHKDILYNSLPLFHGIGSRQGVLPLFMVGGQVYLDKKFRASQFWHSVAKSQATIALLTPSMPAILKSKVETPYDSNHQLRAVYNVLFDEDFEKRFKVHMLSSFAITEIGVVIYTPYGQRKLGSMGKCHEDWDLAIVDEHGNIVQTGQEGQLVCRPKKPYIMMTEYLNMPESTVSAIRHLWYQTSDFMWQDEEGFFYFAGRDKDRIRRRGENISPFEIETEMRTHPDVADCVAVGYPAADGEDEIRVYILGAPKKELSDIKIFKEWVSTRLPAAMIPRYYEYIEQFPLTNTEKIDRKTLRTLELSERSWDSQSI
jgi:crotonobetaine/carnitine-CoA ligase